MDIEKFQSTNKYIQKEIEFINDIDDLRKQKEDYMKFEEEIDNREYQTTFSDENVNEIKDIIKLIIDKEKGK